METEVKMVTARGQGVKLMSCGKENSGEISEGRKLMPEPCLLCKLTHFCWKHVYTLESFSKVLTYYWWW